MLGQSRRFGLPPFVAIGDPRSSRRCGTARSRLIDDPREADARSTSACR
jgi:hypothetical protein